MVECPRSGCIETTVEYYFPNAIDLSQAAVTASITALRKLFFSRAANAAFNVTGYIDKMMGEGYAQAAGVTDVLMKPAVFGFWNPILWLILFVVILAAICIVVLTGKNTRGPVVSVDSQAFRQAVAEKQTAGTEPVTAVCNAAQEEIDGKFATFFGGEKSEHSHVSGSDLFWGFKKNFKGYFTFMDKMHNGNLNDYCIWAVVALAVAVIVIFACML